MYKMVLDTSTKTLYVALVKDDKLLDELYLEGRNDHAKNLFVAIDKLLNNEGIKIVDLDSLVCGIGPGSYTGVRMAVTVGKMLATNSNTKLFSISSLYLMSSGYEGKVLPLIDARRGNSFCACYQDGEVIEEDLLRNTDEFLNNNKDALVVSEDMIKVNPLKVIAKAKLCNKPHGFMPNYLRDTEAERNKHD